MSDGEELTVVEEGKAKIAAKGDSNFFYNPIQEFNRDLTVTVLQQFVDDRKQESEDKASATVEEPVAKKKKFQLENEDGSIRILDALSASGLRALRFAKEVPNVECVLANDFSENAVEAIKRNIELNEVVGKVNANFGDAVLTMMAHRGIDKRFHAVDLDPYGSASVFLDSAVQCVADRGILMITCTDMAVLCGNSPESCYNKYGAVPVRIKCCHEMGLRILLRSIDSHANRYSRYIEPLLCISIDFYVRVFVRMHTGAAKAKDSATKVGRLLVCTGCHSHEIQPILKKTVDGQSIKYGAPVLKSSLLGNENKCAHCGHVVHEGGPIYTAPLHNREFVGRLIKRLEGTPEESRLVTHRRLLGVLSVVSDELDVPLYYLHDELSNVVKSTVPKMIAFRSAILNAGYQVSGSHCHPRAVKTDAPAEFLWDICRAIAKQTNVDVSRMDANLAGRAILEKEKKSEINFTMHPKAQMLTKSEAYVRFQCNKGKNWGPKSKAKGSVNSVKAGFQVESQTLKENQ